MLAALIGLVGLWVDNHRETQGFVPLDLPGAQSLRLEPDRVSLYRLLVRNAQANGDVLFHARTKLQRKGCDLLVVNAVGENRAFEVDNNDGWLLAADGTESALEHGSKTLMASRIVDAIVAFLQNGGG